MSHEGIHPAMSLNPEGEPLNMESAHEALDAANEIDESTRDASVVALAIEQLAASLDALKDLDGLGPSVPEMRNRLRGEIDRLKDIRVRVH